MKKIILISIISIFFITSTVLGYFILNEEEVTASTEEEMPIVQVEEVKPKEIIEEVKPRKETIKEVNARNKESTEKKLALLAASEKKSLEAIKAYAEYQEELRLQKIKDEQDLIARDKRIKEEKEKEINDIMNSIDWYDKEKGIANIFKEVPNNMNIVKEMEQNGLYEVLAYKTFTYNEKAIVDALEKGFIKGVYIDIINDQGNVFMYKSKSESKHSGNITINYLNEKVGRISLTTNYNLHRPLYIFIHSEPINKYNFNRYKEKNEHYILFYSAKRLFKPNINDAL